MQNEEYSLQFLVFKLLNVHSVRDQFYEVFLFRFETRVEQSHVALYRDILVMCSLTPPTSNKIIRPHRLSTIQYRCPH